MSGECEGELTVERVEREKFKYSGFPSVVQTQKLKPPEVLENEQLPKHLRQALKEWYEWFTTWYSMSVETIVEPGVVKIIISCDIEEELCRCEEACVKEAEKELKGEDIEWEEAKEKIWHDCHETCIEDIALSVYININRAIDMLNKILTKYGIKGKMERGWENYEYWARCEVELD